MTRAKTRTTNPRLRNRTGLTLLALGVVLAGIGLWQHVDSYDADSPPNRGGAALVRSIADAVPASQPFRHLTETRVEVGGESLRVVVADTAEERSEGLRRRSTIGEYDGMLFVYTDPVEISFTMSTVPVPLEIAFYDGDGRVVSRLLMRPCAEAASDCPSYSADAEFVYALETLKDDLPAGRLAAA